MAAANISWLCSNHSIYYAGHFNHLLCPLKLNLAWRLSFGNAHVASFVSRTFSPRSSSSSASGLLTTVADSGQIHDDLDFVADQYEYDDDEEEEQEQEQEKEQELGQESVDASSAKGSVARALKRSRQELMQDLCIRFQRNQNYQVTFQELASLYDFHLDKFQRVAIESFLGGSSVVVSAPTSSGKTLIADAAAAVTMARGKRLFYSTPLKALSNQKFREFRDAFGEQNVGLLTGDAMVNSEARIIILTAEILRNMLYQGLGGVNEESRLGQVDVIVMDEVHFLSDISRGTVWEETVIYCPREVQLICLSATIANPEELAGWIRQVHGPTKLVTSNWRPIPLEWHFSTKRGLSSLLNARGTKMNMRLSLERCVRSKSKEYRMKRKKGRTERAKSTNKYSRYAYEELFDEDVQNIRRLHVPFLTDTLSQLIARDMLPAIWFIFSRKGCDDAIQFSSHFNLLNGHEQAKVQVAFDNFQKLYPEAVRKNAGIYLLQGFAVHHAGCLPLWKSFIEDLFQEGLLKVVFATETLAAGINMPARTTVISSLSKRGNDGHERLSTNALFQMAGRAGRRGIDNQGHAVIVQTPFEGAEECCRLIFAGPEPLVSQFSASYGMVLNLLGTRNIVAFDEDGRKIKAVHSGRTLEDARALIEKSFGNYLSSEVMMTAKQKVKELEHKIVELETEINDEHLYNNLRKRLGDEDCNKAYHLLEQLEEMNLGERKLNLELHQKKANIIKPLLECSSEGTLIFVCLHYNDGKAKEHYVPALCFGKVEQLEYEQCFKDPPKMVGGNHEKAAEAYYSSQDSVNSAKQNLDLSCYTALGADNNLYLFTEYWVQTVYDSGSPNISPMLNDISVTELLRNTVKGKNKSWTKLADSEFGNLLFSEGSYETWACSLKIPLVSNLAEEDEIKFPPDYIEFLKNDKDHKETQDIIERKLKETRWYKDFQRLTDENKLKEQKIIRLKAKSDRIKKRISQIEPAGWKQFLMVGRVLQDMNALDLYSGKLFPLGDTASRIRGINELWLAMALSNDMLNELKPAQLAAVCGSLVSEGIRIRPRQTDSYIYETSTLVNGVIESLEDMRTNILEVQQKYNLEISCDLDLQLAGMVEAWASGLSWREIMMDCGIDDGDFARLLRRTIDLLSQIPQLPGITISVRKTASLAANIMDRAPISELVA